MVCSNCRKESKNEAKFCSQCGTSLGDAVQVASNARERDLSEPQPIQGEEGQASSIDKVRGSLSIPTVLLGLVGGVLFLLLILAVAISGSNSSSGDKNEPKKNDGAGSVNNSTGGMSPDNITVEKFACTLGTRTASTILKNSGRESVNAFVTVGLYGSEGTLQHTATNWGLVEAGGTSLINVSLDPYFYSVGKCSIINVGY